MLRKSSGFKPSNRIEAYRTVDPERIAGAFIQVSWAKGGVEAREHNHIQQGMIIEDGR